jgi:hypothetical protein
MEQGNEYLSTNGAANVWSHDGWNFCRENGSGIPSPDRKQ